MGRDGNAQAEDLVPGQGMILQDDGTEAGSELTEWPDAAEESHTALREVMTAVAWEFLDKLRTEFGRSAGCRAQMAVAVWLRVAEAQPEPRQGTYSWGQEISGAGDVKRVGESALSLLHTSCGWPFHLGNCRGIILCTSYSRTKDYVKLRINGYDTAYTFTQNNSMLEHNAMNNIDTVAHMNVHNAQD